MDRLTWLKIHNNIFFSEKLLTVLNNQWFCDHLYNTGIKGSDAEPSRLEGVVHSY